MPMSDEEIAKAASGSPEEFQAALAKAAETKNETVEKKEPETVQEVKAEATPEAPAEKPKAEEKVPETPVAEAEKVETPTETPEEKAAREHKEKSSAGRKRKEQEEARIKILEQEIADLKAKISAPPPKVEPPIDDDALLTRKEVEAEFERIQAKKETERLAKERERKVSYEDIYLKTLDGLKELETDEELYEEVHAEITKLDSEFNVQHSWEGQKDAAKNYKAAREKILKSKPKPKENPLKGNPPAIPLGVASGSKVEAQKKPEVPLSPQAKEFIRKYASDMTQKQIEEALK